MEKKVSSPRGGYLEALLNGSPVAIIAISSEGIITFANRATCSLVECEIQELIGASIGDLYESLEEARETNRKLYQNDGIIHDHESGMRAKSGKIVPVRISACHLKDSAGKYIGAIGYFEQHRPWSGAEPQISRHIEELEAKLDEYKGQSAPVFELFPGLSMVIITGPLDRGRFGRINEHLLKHVEKMKARVTIIDISESSITDEGLTRELVKTLRTLHLLGTQCVLIGVQTSIAKEMETLIADLGTVRSFPSRDAALKAALENIGLEVRKKD